LAELRAALERGVILDVANASFHYSIDIVRIAMEQGIVLHSLSTDLSIVSFENLVFSLLVTMSKFLAIGFDIEQLIRMTTMNPASVLTGGKDRRSLKKGMPADISILDLQEGSYRFNDGIEERSIIELFPNLVMLRTLIESRQNFTCFRGNICTLRFCPTVPYSSNHLCLHLCNAEFIRLANIKISAGFVISEKK